MTSKTFHADFPDGAVVKNLPANAGTGSIPGAGRYHVPQSNWTCAPQLLKPMRRNCWARVLQLLKPALLEPVLRNKRSHCNEKPTHCNEEWLPLAATKAHAQQRRPNIAKNKFKKNQKTKNFHASVNLDRVQTGLAFQTLPSQASPAFLSSISTTPFLLHHIALLFIPHTALLHLAAIPYNSLPYFTQNVIHP